ncbi:hypothetical protein H5410_034147 [Solanum commersonii]|uniref:Uncharacterized protein n=1 Tax=Solanum commersonii TaxID=4109 RepID=A0A9J5YQK9_SOLCO|nr:hypothetical protein H5410_034147 [Solanum commersonii]
MQLKIVVAFLVLLWISFVEIHIKKITTRILKSCKLQSRSKRIKLKDGRYVAYRERGVPINKSICRIITVYGIHSTKEVDVWL